MNDILKLTRFVMPKKVELFYQFSKGVLHATCKYNILQN